MPSRGPIPIQDWGPDLDSTSEGILTDMNGFFPATSGYATLPALTQISNALPHQVLGGYSALLISTPIIVGATANALYNLVNNVWVPQFAGLSNTVNRWSFAAFGQDLIGVNGVDAPLFFRQSSGVWTNLSGTPPVASIVEATDNAVILVSPNSQTFTSNLSDTATWTPSIPAQVYQFQLTTTEGNITACHRLRGGVGFYKPAAIQMAQFIGGSFGWSLTTISNAIGVPFNDCVINLGDVQYFVGPDDFYSFDGYNVLNIPNNVKEMFFGQNDARALDQSNLKNIAGRYDRVRKLVVWHYPSISANPAGSLDSYIGFYVRKGNWFGGRLAIDLPMQGDLSTTNQGTAVFLNSHTLFKYDPTANLNVVSSVYVTGWDVGDKRYIYQTNRLRPGFQVYPVSTVGGQPPARLNWLNQYVPGTTPVAGPTAPISDDGWFNVLNSNRLQRPQIEVYGGCQLNTLEIPAVPVGEV